MSSFLFKGGRSDLRRFARVKRNFLKKNIGERLPFDAKTENLGSCTSAFLRDPSLQEVARKVLGSSLQSGTISNYEGVVRDFKDFTSKNDYSEKPTEQSVSHFLLHLEKNQVTDSYICKVKPALSMYEQIINSDSTAFTKPVIRILDGVKNLAVSRKLPVKKAPRLNLDIIKKMVEKVIIPYVPNPERVNGKDLRTVFRVTVIYFTFCRFNCFSSLKAENFHDNGTDIDVYFTRAKNDPKHKGNITKMVQNGTKFCPVFITRFYFKRFGFVFGNKYGEGEDRRFVNCRLRRIDYLWQPQAGAGLSNTTATEQLRNLIRKIGESAERITEKSVKMEGVTKMLDSGATMIDVANHGRWKTVEIVQTYKHNSDQYKRRTASQIPF